MSLGSHQQTIGKSQIHITPKWIVDALGPFDTDPCAADPRPWDCARQNYSVADNGLSKTWTGRVWLNPPFHRYQVKQWMERMAKHNNGIALLHARTETDWFRSAWAGASAMLFMSKRITFHKPDGSLCTTAKGEVANSGAPPVLIAFNGYNASALARSKIEGALVTNWKMNYAA